MQSLETKSSRRETKSRDSITGNKEQKIWEGIVLESLPHPGYGPD